METANKVFLAKDNIVEIHVVGDQTPDTVRAMGEQAKELLESMRAAHKPGLILDDLTVMGQTTAEVRKTVAALAKILPYEKIAMVGNGTVFMRYGTNLMLQAMNMGNKIKYFENRQKAVDWLLGKR